MHQAGDLHPFRFTIPPDGLSCLKEMFNLGDISLEGVQLSDAHILESSYVRVRVIDQRIELLHGFPDT